jgi:hypothetical protein
MKMTVLVINFSLFVFGCLPALAGDIDSPAPPSEAGSAMHSLEDVYNRLSSGAAGVKRSGAFTEPTAAPGPTGKSLNEIMSVAPTADNTNGAAPADVASGKTYWGLRTDGSWGAQTGTGSGGNDGNGSAFPAPVPRTGQTTSYAANDDGDLQAGVTWPNPRFTDNGDGTVTDNLTGLIWLQNANCFNPRTWGDALTDAANLKAPECGLSDGSAAGSWRLPSVRELYSLIDLQYSTPSLSNGAGTAKWTSGDAFYNVMYSNHYWSSTTNANDTNRAWIVFLSTGLVSNSTKASGYYVWPVRGGQ